MLVGWEVRRRKMIFHRNLSLVLKIVKGIIWLIHKCCPKSHYFGNDLMLCGWRLGAASPLTLPGVMPLMQLLEEHQTAATASTFWPCHYPQTRGDVRGQFFETFLSLSFSLAALNCFCYSKAKISFTKSLFQHRRSLKLIIVEKYEELGL